MADVREFDVSGLTYASKPDHRDNTAVKSQWTINVEQEIECFRFTQARRWFDDDRGWGLHLENGSAAYLGVGIDRTHELFVARFESDRNNTYWHGYPADHTRRTDDIPTEGIALQWIADNFVHFVHFAARPGTRGKEQASDLLHPVPQRGSNQDRHHVARGKAPQAIDPAARAEAACARRRSWRPRQGN